jgi:hypothetical protein
MHLPRKFLVSSALALVLLITLMAGIKPKGYRFRNDVTLTPNHGMSIGRTGIAFSKDSLQWKDPDQSDSGFTIELSIKPARLHSWGLSEILGFWDGTFPEPLTINQWKNHLVIHVRDDRAQKGYQEFRADSIFERDKSCIIQIVSDRSKTVIYVNGMRTGGQLSGAAFVRAGFHGRLLLGNSVTGNSAWSGEFYGLAFYQREMSSEETVIRFRQWDSLGRAALAPPSRAAHFFAFSEAGGAVIRDFIASGFDLQIPTLFHIIKKQVLVGPWDDFQWNRGYLFDVIINLFGFVPLGLFLSLFLSSVVAIHSRKKNLLFTISICFVISLGIELAQVYIPTRDSQLSDLICNTLGGTIGGFLGTWKRK